MAKFTQANRPLRLSTPLGSDALSITRLSGQEAMSQLYAFQLDVLTAADKPVDFAKLLSEPVGLLGAKRLKLRGDSLPKHRHGQPGRWRQLRKQSEDQRPTDDRQGNRDYHVERR